MIKEKSNLEKLKIFLSEIVSKLIDSVWSVVCGPKKIWAYMKNRKNKFLNVAWYAFIVLVIGQIGPIIGFARSFWLGGDVVGKIEESASKGELLTCAIAILAASTFFLVKEYNSSRPIEKRGLKSWLLLWTILCGFGCVLISVDLLSHGNTKFSTDLQRSLHWTLYVFSMVTAFFLWMLEEWQTSAIEETDEWNNNAASLIKESERETTISGTRI